MSIQTIVMDEIKRSVEEKNLTFSVDYQFANTGTIRIMKGLKTILAFAFNFQSSWKTIKFQFYPGDKNVVATCGFTHGDCIRTDYFEYHQIETQVPNIIDFIKGYAEKQLAS